MCGIGGIYSRTGPVPPPWIKAMTGALRHRGPDDEGYLAVDAIGGLPCSLTGVDSQTEGLHIDTYHGSASLFLSHRRLSIIDTSSAGHQPMSNNTGSLWIIFNGEIYNYRELREELRSTGYIFKSQTDTEVILAAYETWGRDCLEKFNGMWAFVLLDRKKKLLFGSRDRFGVKPLYYYAGNDFFAFASEMKALLKMPFISKTINPAAVFDYLALGLQENEEEGFFKGIYELQPAHNFELDLTSGKFSKWRYYSLGYAHSWEDFDEKKYSRYSADIRNLISDAVTMRLRSDVPTGSCLSGGLDSSTIVCLIHHLLKKGNIPNIGEKQRVFTASFPAWRQDESGWAERVVDATGASWFCAYPQAHELQEDLADLVYTQDIPFLSTSVYSQYRVMKLASQHNVRVLLDGQGADELFAGYTEFYRAFFAEILRNRKGQRLLAELRGLKNSPVSLQTVASSMVRLLGVRFLPAGFLDVLLRRTVRANKYISGDLWSECRHRLEAVQNTAVLSLNDMLCRYMIGPNLKTLLRYEDRNSMRFSVEARTPFADDLKLIEYIFRIPSSYKIYKGWSKALLRASMSGILPREILERRDKIGFTTPEEAWLTNMQWDPGEYINDDLHEFLDVRAVIRDWKGLCRTPGQAWRMMNLGIWLQKVVKH